MQVIYVYTHVCSVVQITTQNVFLMAMSTTREAQLGLGAPGLASSCPRPSLSAPSHSGQL